MVLSQVTDPFAVGGMTLVPGGEKVQVEGQIGVVTSASGGTGTGVTFAPALGGVSTIPNAVPVTEAVAVGMGGGTKQTYAGSQTILYRLNSGIEELNLTFIGSVLSSLNNGGFSSAPGSCAVAANALGAPLCAGFGITFNKAAGTVSFINTPMGTGVSGNAPTVSTLNGSLTFPPF